MVIDHLRPDLNLTEPGTLALSEVTQHLLRICMMLDLSEERLSLAFTCLQIRYALPIDLGMTECGRDTKYGVIEGSFSLQHT